MLLGAHESTSGGWHRAFQDGMEDGCEALQIFTKPANQWREPKIDEKKVEKWKEFWKESGISEDAVLSHNSYLINICSPKEPTYSKSIKAMIEELKRCQILGIKYLVMHPGSHLGKGEEWGIKRIAKSLDKIFKEVPGKYPMILLETTAGQGTNLGYRFEHLAEIINLSNYPERLAVCFDTCHVYAAGYDIKSEKGYEKTFERFDKIIGLNLLKAFHINDSKKELGTRIDRHENIGKGVLGVELFKRLINDPRFETHPGILETIPLPDGSRGYKENLDLLKSLRDKK